MGASMEKHKFGQNSLDLKSIDCIWCGLPALSGIHSLPSLLDTPPREQVGGDHYQTPEGIPEHWDIAIALGWDFFQYQITKYLWRWKRKDGLTDLRKAQHFLAKYIATVEARGGKPPEVDSGEPGPKYTNQGD